MTHQRWLFGNGSLPFAYYHINKPYSRQFWLYLSWFKSQTQWRMRRCEPMFSMPLWRCNMYHRWDCCTHWFNCSQGIIFTNFEFRFEIWVISSDLSPFKIMSDANVVVVVLLVMVSVLVTIHARNWLVTNMNALRTVVWYLEIGISKVDRFTKVGCVFPMVVVSILPQVEFGPNDQGNTHPTLFPM